MNKEAPLPAGALAGIRVVDLSRILAGPYCTMMLGDLGAEVIKIEEPSVGDGTRAWGPPWVGGSSPDDPRQSAYFLSVNRNKKSVTLNLKHPTGQALLRRFVATADVLVENFKAGSLAHMGLDYKSLTADYPSLVYCSLTGYGQHGPYCDRPGYDSVIQAEGGIMSITGPADGGPFKVGVAIVDVSAGLYAALAILAALRHRERTGRGQHIDIALLDAQLAWLVNVAHNYFVAGQPPARYGNAHPNIVPYETFQTADGYLALGVGSDRQYQRLCDVIGRPELWADECFQTNAGRVAHRVELIPKLQATFRTRSTQVWVDLLNENQIPAGPVNDIPTALTDPHVQARGMVQTVSHPVLGAQQQLGPVPRLSATPATIRLAPPLLGEHTEQVLRDELGCTPEDIKRLRRENVI